MEFGGPRLRSYKHTWRRGARCFRTQCLQRPRASGRKPGWPGHSNLPEPSWWPQTDRFRCDWQSGFHLASPSRPHTPGQAAAGRLLNRTNHTARMGQQGWVHRGGPEKQANHETDWAGCGAVRPWVCPRKRKSLTPSHCSAAVERQQPPALLQLPRNLPRSLVRSIKRGSNQHRCEAAASPCGAASEPRCCHGHPVRAQRGWDSGSVRVGCGRPFT